VVDWDMSPDRSEDGRQQRHAQPTSPARTPRASSPAAGGVPQPVTVIGVYGKGNFGDEALLAAVADDLRTVLGPIEVQVLCSDPESVTRRFGFLAMTRTPAHGFRQKLALVRRSRIVVVGGGTLLCDHGGPAADLLVLATYFFWLLLARAFGVATVAYGQGFGPAGSRIVRFGLWLLPRVVSAVTTRDRASHAMLGRIAGDRANCVLGADPVIAGDLFLPTVAADRVPPALARQVQGVGPYVLIALRYAKFGGLDPIRPDIAAASRLAARIGQDEPARFVLFPTHLSDAFVDDRPVVDLVYAHLLEAGIPAERLTRASWGTLEEAAFWIQSAELVFGDRLHALLLGMLARRPVVGLTVEDKIAGCIGDIAGDRPVAVIASLKGDDPASIEAAVQRLWSERGSHDDVYLTLLEAYRARRAANLAMLEQVVGRGRRALVAPPPDSAAQLH
jgi:L-malate glycosyltransferase